MVLSFASAGIQSVVAMIVVAIATVLLGATAKVIGLTVHLAEIISRKLNSGLHTIRSCTGISRSSPAALKGVIQSEIFARKLWFSARCSFRMSASHSARACSNMNLASRRDFTTQFKCASTRPATPTGAVRRVCNGLTIAM